MGGGAEMGDNRFSYTWKLQHRIGSSLQKNSLEHVFNETSFLSCSRKALGTLALLGVIGRLPFSLDKPAGLCGQWQPGDDKTGGTPSRGIGPSAAFTHLPETYAVCLLKGPTKISQLQERLGAVRAPTHYRCTRISAQKSLVHS